MTMAKLDPLALAQVIWALTAEVQDLSQEAPAGIFARERGKKNAGHTDLTG